ncbi:MAG TPA: MgtC/SapB family protein [Candidatus Binatus sp.]|nr:MgtC/SapB family protein [Candidatus Binatus sp.]
MEQFFTMPELHALGRLLFGAALGVGIGLERQWRQSLSGGLQTCALVAAGATLYTIITPLIGGNGGDPARIAGQVVTGIGFLAGGVILREGMNVRGLNTAATIWATAAVGCLAGLGLYVEAVAGAAAIAGLNWFLSPLVDYLNRRNDTHREMRYEVTTICTEQSEATVDKAVLDAVKASHLTLSSRDAEAGSEPGTARIVVELVGRWRDHTVVARLVDLVRALNGVSDASWAAKELRS